MCRDSTRQGSLYRVPLLFALLLLIVDCGETAAAQTGTANHLQSSPDDLPPSSDAVRLPMNVERQTGDLDEKVKRGSIRALVVLDPISFFYDGGVPRGLMYEALV